jgi:N-terminal acetyltransferase B complex non-catalytic subunit
MDQESSRVVNLVREYFEALPLGRDLPKLELQPADDLAILAAQVYVNMFVLDHTVAHLHNAIVLLEYALKKSPHSYQIRLELVRIYRLLGVVAIFYLAYPIVLAVFLARRTTASFRSLSSFECETNSE